MARLTLPGIPHHVTQRGNRRQEIFFSGDDYGAYVDLLAEYCAKAGTEIWAYCLMPNHVHLIVQPSHDDGLRAALGEAHRRYTRRINQREDWRGHLFQERFHSFPMDAEHTLACARYVELNPVRAGLVRQARDWPHSSANAHLAGDTGGPANVRRLLDRVTDWATFLDQGLADDTLEALRRHARTGRALGSERFHRKLTALLGRDTRPRTPGRPRKKSA